MTDVPEVEAKRSERPFRVRGDGALAVAGEAAMGAGGSVVATTRAALAAVAAVAAG